MSFAAAKQLVPPLGDGVSVGDPAVLPWEGGTDDSLVKAGDLAVKFH